MKFKAILGVMLIVAGAVLVLFFWDLRVQWFQGGPVGVLLMTLGVWDLWDGFKPSKGRKKPRSLLDELREDFSSKPLRHREDDDHS